MPSIASETSSPFWFPSALATSGAAWFLADLWLIDWFEFEHEPSRNSSAAFGKEFEHEKGNPATNCTSRSAFFHSARS